MMINGIHIITGQKGNGKTLWTVTQILEELKNDRVVATCNINGLNIEGVITINDPDEWHTLPAGALLIVDEAQRYWRTSRSGDIPKSLTDMETSRHEGLSFLLITQHPTFLHTHLRKLCDYHTHMVRRSGYEAAFRYTWERICETPLLQTERDLAEQELWLFPKDNYKYYTSAQIHTIKKSIPKRLKYIFASLFLLAGLGYVIYSKVQTVMGEQTDSKASPALAAEAMESDKTPLSKELLAYNKKITPLIPSQPWTAIGFSDQKFVSKPRIFCMSTAKSCRCLTEQGTRYELDYKTCRVTARWGSEYNPFKEEQKSTIQPIAQQATFESSTTKLY